MAENPILRRNEEETNKLVARVMLYCIPFFPFVMVLRLLGMFSTPLEQYLAPFGLAVVLLLIPTILLSQGVTGPWVKYVIVAAAIGAVTALYSNYWEIGRFVEFLWLFPAIVASAYVSPVLTAYSALASIVLMDIFFAAALPARPLYITEYVTVHNLFADLVLRDINLAAITVALYGLSLRYRRLLNDLVSAEEQGLILSRLTKLMNETARAAKNILGASERLARTTEESEAASQHTTRLSKELAAQAEETIHRLRRSAPALKAMVEELRGLYGKVKETAAAVEEIVSTADLSRKAFPAADEEIAAIEEISGESKALVARLGERSENIGEIVRMITNIARQTKLLAINASIEAARAGEEGRGFHAIALSIRDLATQSSQAAEGITEVIKEIQEHTVRAATVIEQGTTRIATGLAELREIGASFAQVAGAREALREELGRLAETLARLAETGGTLASLVQGIEEGKSVELAKAQEITRLMLDQEANLRFIRDALGELLETAETLRALGGGGAAD